MANQPRAAIVGPDNGPKAPYPLYMRGEVVSGFGRGSKEVRRHLTCHAPFIPPIQASMTSEFESSREAKRGLMADNCIARYPNSKHPRRLRALDKRHTQRRLLRLRRHLAFPLHSYYSLANFHLDDLSDGNVHRLQPVLQKHSPQRRSPRPA